MSNADWLDEVGADSTAMGEVKQMIQTWRDKRKAMVLAEAAFLQAKAEYEDYVKQTACSTLRMNGLESLKLEDGTLVTVVTQTKCGVKKSEADKKNVADWLKAQGVDRLVSETLTVMPSAKDKLEELGIAYDRNVTMNTNSIKAYILSEMRVGNLSQDDLPNGLSWYQWDDIQVS